jgi:hypothetical protein
LTKAETHVTDYAPSGPASAIVRHWNSICELPIAGKSRRILKRPVNFGIVDHSPRIGGFAEHQGSTKLTPRGHPINATESERKTFEAGFNAWRRPAFSEHMPGCLRDGGCPNLGKAFPKSRSARHKTPWHIGVTRS